MKLYIYICMPLLFIGQVVDGFGGAPAPWSIPVPIPFPLPRLRGKPSAFLTHPLSK